MPQSSASKRQSAIRLYESAIARHEDTIAAYSKLPPAVASATASVAMIEEGRAEIVASAKAKIANLKILIEKTSQKY